MLSGRPAENISSLIGKINEPASADDCTFVDNNNYIFTSK